ncbi:MAG: hypothetical protein EGW04_01690, partial [Rothia mucilaginosa]|nr:hypothetical protein [Rothia mucilaginosa]
LDEAIQCYHGDLEYRDMLGCLYEFGQGEIDAEVAEKLETEGLSKFDVSWEELLQTVREALDNAR